MIVRNAKGILTRFYACEYHILNLKRERRDWKVNFGITFKWKSYSFEKQTNKKKKKKKTKKKKKKKKKKNRYLESWCYYNKK